LGIVISLSLTSCTSKEAIRKALNENPEIIFEVIEKNPEKFAEAMQKANQQFRRLAQEKAERDQKKKIDEEFKNPKKPEVGEGRATRGPKDAPILLVEYSDFECPYCQRGFQTVEDVLKGKYGDKIRFIYKHLPLSFHPNALPASKYFEAIAMQDPEKAYRFHDELFQNQKKLSEGEKFLQSLAKKVGADLVRLKKALDSEEVKKRIEADKAEAEKFGFTGTPGFLVGGVSVAGAYPAEHLEKIIERHLNGSRETASK